MQPPLQEVTLDAPAGYDRRAVVTGTMAGQLDRLLAALTARVEGAAVDELEWQLRPGVNSIGMLLTHMALSEAFWMQAAWRGISVEDEDRAVHSLLGMRMADDGMPLAPDGRHPAALAGNSAAHYLGVLGRARQATHAALRVFDDARLDEILIVDGRGMSRGWILHHIVEHFAQHLGQIGLLLSLRRLTGGA